MRWVFSRRVPETSRILLVESGKREVSEKLIPHLKRNFGEDVAIDLLTCLPDEPDQNRGSPGPSGVARHTIRRRQRAMAFAAGDPQPAAQYRGSALCRRSDHGTLADRNVVDDPGEVLDRQRKRRLLLA